MDFSVLILNLSRFFYFDSKSPIIFNSGQFLLFFTLFLFVYIWIFNRVNWRIGWLTLFSIFFYYKSSGIFVLLLMGTIIFNWFIAIKLEQKVKEQERKFILVISVLLNLGALIWYKYSNFFLKTYCELSSGKFEPLQIILPVGISFFTFQTVSYLVDVYKKEIPASRNLIDFAFYLSFFPQLVAGPIVRASDFIVQIRKKIEFRREEVGEGLFLILKGFVKKAIIADYVAQYADLVYGNPAGYSGFENWIAMYAYTLQIYCDFSGYSDMAIGISLILGFKLLDNFKSPYQSLDITTFWRRWHISLSFWLRDYVYIPLGGNRGAGFGAKLLTLLFMLISVLITRYWWLIPIYLVLVLAAIFYFRKKEGAETKIFTYVNQLLTMLIGGWWHGADWKFVFWGFMHGLGLIVHKLFSKYVPIKKSALIVNAISWLITFHFVAFLWIFFRAPSFDIAIISIGKMFSDFSLSYAMPFLTVRPVLVLMLLIGFGIHFVKLEDKDQMSKYFSSMPFLFKLIAFVIAIQLSIQFQDENVQPFIYFQF
jgi:alginate O-acetyltransferase complex protein AlgI